MQRILPVEIILNESWDLLNIIWHSWCLNCDIRATSSTFLCIHFLTLQGYSLFLYSSGAFAVAITKQISCWSTVMHRYSFDSVWNLYTITCFACKSKMGKSAIFWDKSSQKWLELPISDVSHLDYIHLCDNTFWGWLLQRNNGHCTQFYCCRPLKQWMNQHKSFLLK